MKLPNAQTAGVTNWLGDLSGDAIGAEGLTIALGVKSTAGSYAVPGGQVKAVSLDLTRWGFSARVEFVVSVESDGGALVKALGANELLRVELSITTLKDPGQPQPPPLVLHGIARGRSVAGLSYGDVDGSPRAFHHCGIDFGDPASVLWRQHRPIELYTGKSLADVLNAHKPEGVSLTYDWTTLDTARPMIFLGIGADDPRP